MERKKLDLKAFPVVGAGCVIGSCFFSGLAIAFLSIEQSKHITWAVIIERFFGIIVLAVLGFVLAALGFALSSTAVKMRFSYRECSIIAMVFSIIELAGYALLMLIVFLLLYLLNRYK